MQNALERYINKKSFWHNINPTVKLIIIVFLITIVFLPIGFFGILISTCLIILIWISAKLPAKLFKSIFLTWIIMFLLLGIINWIAYKSPGFDADIANNGMNVIFGFAESGWLSIHSACLCVRLTSCPQRTLWACCPLSVLRKPFSMKE